MTKIRYLAVTLALVATAASIGLVYLTSRGILRFKTRKRAGWFACILYPAVGMIYLISVCLFIEGRLDSPAGTISIGIYAFLSVSTVLAFALKGRVGKGPT